MPTNHPRVAIYARVSSEQQAQQDTIASQLEALERRLGVAAGASLEPRLIVAVSLAAVRACIEHQQNGGAGRLERNIDQAFDRVAAGLR